MTLRRPFSATVRARSAASAAVALLLALAPGANAQMPADEDATKLSVTLVRVDAVVTDEHGGLVTDLKAEDFEVFEDGKPQTLTGLSYVAANTPAAATGGASAAVGKPSEPLPAGSVKRTVAFVVDDLFLSSENVPKVKRAMHEFVDTRMQPGDLVAVIRTSGGASVTSQLSSDPRELDAAIDRLHWNAQGAKGASTFEPPDESIVNNRSMLPRRGAAAAGAARADSIRTDQAKRSSEDAQLVRERHLATATLDALAATVAGLDDLPGRKSVVLFSEGFRALGREFARNYESGEGERTLHPDAYGSSKTEAGESGLLAYLQRVVDRANRAAVSIYAVDPRGVVDASFASAQSSTIVLDRARRDRFLGEQRDNYLASSTVLHFLADKTGGEVTSSNDPGFGVRRAVDALAGYYALDYQPDDSTFADPKAPVFHEIAVRVKRSGVHVRARSGFYGLTDAQLDARRPLAERVSSALMSPFGATDVAVHVAAQCTTAAEATPTIRAVVRVDPAGIGFAKSADGANEATVNVFAVLLGADGAVVAKAEKTNPVRLADADLERLRAEGITFVVNLPAAAPGAYRVRAAVRDAASDRIGSAGQFVEVPDVAHGAFAISGVVLGSESGRFRPGTQLTYGFVAYNAKAEHDLPKLTMTFAIWQDGKRLFESPAQPLDLNPQPNWRVIDLGGGFGIRDRMKPGAYRLEITVADELAKGATATGWADFEVIP